MGNSTTDAAESRCPNCGYCPHCGRSNGYWTMPYVPDPSPKYPIYTVYPTWTGGTIGTDLKAPNTTFTVTSGTNVTTYAS